MAKTVAAFGEILWDILPSGEVLGGAPFNFAYRVSSLGHRGAMISAVGDDEYGRRAMAEVEAMGMETGYIQRKSGVPTGTVDVRFDERNLPSYVINAPAAYDAVDPTAEARALVAGADCLCCGSLIRRTPHGAATLDALVDAFAGSIVLCDVNLRKDCYTPESLRAAVDRCTILKLNENELPEIALLYGAGGEGIPEMVDSLIGEAGLSACVVTLGPDGAYAASKNGERCYAPAFRVPVVDTVGSGDAFTAGFVDGLLRGRPLSEAARIGSALGSLVAGVKGGTGAVSREEIDEILGSSDYERISEELREFMAE